MAICPPCHTRTSATSDDWITPKKLIDKIGPFDLDPCSSETQPWPCARTSWTAKDNGLMRDWGRNFVYCNPPYGRAMEKWLQRLSLHNHGIALIFARTETRQFFRYVWPIATAILFIRGRLTFSYPDGTEPRSGHNSGGPSCLITYGEKAAARLEEHKDLGALVYLRDTQGIRS